MRDKKELDAIARENLEGRLSIQAEYKRFDALGLTNLERLYVIHLEHEIVEQYAKAVDKWLPDDWFYTLTERRSMVYQIADEVFPKEPTDENICNTAKMLGICD